MKKTLLIIALLLGLLTRIYDFRSRFIYAHDNDLASWIVKDIIIDKHPRLIGQLTSSPGIFIGGLFYYSLIPFYFITRLDPIGTLAFSWIIGIAAILSIYYTFNKLFSCRAAAIGSLIYAISFSISASEREVVPTTPVMLWSIWFFYAIHKLFAGDRKSLLILAVLFGLVWHINLALGLLFPLVVVGVFINRKTLKVKDLLIPIFCFLILSLPLIVFELKHDWQQSKSLTRTLTSVSPGTVPVTKINKFQTTFLYASRNVNKLFFAQSLPGVWFWLFPAVLLLGLRRHKLIYSLWMGLYLIFFSLHPIQLSEYYLNGLNILWIAAATLILADSDRRLAAVILTGFMAINLNSFLTTRYTKSGYIEKKALIAYIKQDAISHGYPCIAVSYITSVGNNLGYRYLFWLAGIKVMRPDSGSPVYSIVFPQSIVNHLDKSFGALGIVNPDYSRYTEYGVEQSCQGNDANLTESMFGFTK